MCGSSGILTAVEELRISVTMKKLYHFLDADAEAPLSAMNAIRETGKLEEGQRRNLRLSLERFTAEFLKRL